MAFAVKRTAKEIDDLMNLASEWGDRGGSSCPGASYESGVVAAIRWLKGLTDEFPIEYEPEDD